jgi:hypothetical protein
MEDDDEGIGGEEMCIELGKEEVIERAGTEAAEEPKSIPEGVLRLETEPPVLEDTHREEEAGEAEAEGRMTRLKEQILIPA